jgi:hypothetical protein
VQGVWTEMEVGVIHDITDTLRTQEQLYRQTGNERQGDVLRAARKEIELLREEVRLAASSLRATAADHAAIREAAKGLLIIHRRHKDLTVYSDQDYMDIWRERVDALAALVGEG